jgi:hypothetical protein
VALRTQKENVLPSPTPTLHDKVTDKVNDKAQFTNQFDEFSPKLGDNVLSMCNVLFLAFGNMVRAQIQISWELGSNFFVHTFIWKFFKPFSHAKLSSTILFCHSSEVSFVM